jgi:hypothetical protein
MGSGLDAIHSTAGTGRAATVRMQPSNHFLEQPEQTWQPTFPRRGLPTARFSWERVYLPDDAAKPITLILEEQLLTSIASSGL